ncbi:MAG: lysostaphin resistance A-like protein, partial [Acidimicrobiia bacterium]
VAWARAQGLSWQAMGMGGGSLRSGLRWGGLVAAAVALPLGVAVAVPGLRPLLDDARVAEITVPALMFHALVRIPLGTALWEEVAFRGVLFGAWARLRNPLVAAIGSSLVFGLWHIRPALTLLDVNDIAQGPGLRILARAAALIVTVVAGLFFCWLRLRSRSLVAPLTAHVAINSLAIAAAAAAQRLG